MVAIVEKQASNIDYSQFFDFEFIQYSLVDKRIGSGVRLKKADITLDFDELKDEDFIILVGAEPAKFVAKISSVTQYQGYLLDDKYLPLINPAMIRMKPAGEPAFREAVKNINEYVTGIKEETAVVDIEGITEEAIAIKYLSDVLYDTSINTIALDTETTALYPRDGYLLGISVSHKEHQGVYISADCISPEVEYLLNELTKCKKIIFHNAKFDIKFLRYHLGLTFPNWEDTMLLHYCLNEQPGTHGLKQLTIKYLDLGDYDKPLEDFKSQYCKDYGIKKADFTYDLIPFDTIYPYAATDTAATLALYNMFNPLVYKNDRLKFVYEFLLKEGTEFCIDIEENGVPFDIDRLLIADDELTDRILELEQQLYTFDEVKNWESANSKVFNANSPMQLRDILFNPLYLGLKPVAGKLTGTGAISTDAEVLEVLSSEHDLPELIVKIKQAKKIKSTYIKKILAGLDKDGRLRTGFNLTTTTSGRLSSSGKLNMQQLPRDDKTVKFCIKARPGFKIVSQDLATAEMYVAAVLSKDKHLQQVFTGVHKGNGADFHSAIAHMVFNLPCEPSEVKELYPAERQAAKAVSFGIMYGSGPQKVADTVGCSLEEAKGHIKTYFRKFARLEKWLREQQEYIKKHGNIYSIFGRKRRLNDVFSPDRKTVGHEVRSGVNFLVQSVASDINLFAAIDLNKWIKQNGYEDKVKIFGLVHDSILAEVHESILEEYNAKTKYLTQIDRGCSIPGCPVGVDTEIGDNYSFKDSL